MKTASKFATVFALVAFAASPALAQSSDSTTALDAPPPPGSAISATSADMMMTEGAYNVFFSDPEGTTMREMEDARAMYMEASEEDRAVVDMACTNWEEEQVAFLDSVSSTCKGFAEAQ